MIQIGLLIYHAFTLYSTLGKLNEFYAP